MTPNEQKARELVSEHTRYSAPALAGNIVATLNANGLIVTDLHTRALAACEAHYTKHPTCDRNGDADRPCDLCGAIGRESLAAKKPKERWTVARLGCGLEYRALHSDGLQHRTFPADAEPEARAYVARKNAEEGK